MNTTAWDFVFYALLGIVITVAVRIADVVIVFAFLIIPATLSAILAEGWGMRLLIAWITGVVATGLGLLFANAFDFSVGPAITLFLGAVLMLTASLRQMRVTKTAASVASLTVAAGLFVWFLSLSGSSGSAEANAQNGPGRSSATVFQHEAGIGETDKLNPSRIAVITDPTELIEVFNGSVDVEVRTAAVIRCLEVDSQKGASLAIEFLAVDPPLLYRRDVVNKLQDVSGRMTDYVVDEPFSSATNQRIIKALAKQ